MLDDECGVLDERLQVGGDEIPQAQVDEQLVHRRIAHALADPERGAVHAIGDRGRRECVDRAEAPVVVAVVVQLHVPPFDDVGAKEREEVAHAFGRGVADRVRRADPLQPAAMAVS